VDGRINAVLNEPTSEDPGGCGSAGDSLETSIGAEMEYEDTDKCECRHAWSQHKHGDPDRTHCTGTAFRGDPDPTAKCSCGKFTLKPESN